VKNCELLAAIAQLGIAVELQRGWARSSNQELMSRILAREVDDAVLIQLESQSRRGFSPVVFQRDQTRETV